MTQKRTLALVCFALAIAIGAWTARRAPTHSERSLAERLLGPIAGLAAAAEWVRADAAWAHGRIDLYDARAEFALALAPRDPNGWAYYAHHLVYDRASPRRARLLEEREVWVRAGLAVLERGESVCREPGRLAFRRAIVFLSLAQVDDAERPLPVTRREAWTSAAEAFERAAKLGEPLAAEAAAGARAEAEALK
ncbi:MAG: hypothetical protein SGI72_06710 [Planctomycetota bacterium]|nr:hypothetical protein [Planctomycetota bacterium]